MNRHTNRTRGYATFVIFRFPLFGIFLISLSAEDCTIAAGRKGRKNTLGCEVPKQVRNPCAQGQNIQTETGLHFLLWHDPYFMEEELRFIRLDDMIKAVGLAGADLGHRSTV